MASPVAATPRSISFLAPRPTKARTSGIVMGRRLSSAEHVVGGRHEIGRRVHQRSVQIENHGLTVM